MKAHVKNTQQRNMDQVQVLACYVKIIFIYQSITDWKSKCENPKISARILFQLFARKTPNS